MFVNARFLARGAIVSVAAALALFPGCSGESKSGGTSNPSWLRSCDSDAACGHGLSCLCGICTLECRLDADCGTLGDSATCRLDPDLASACFVNGVCTRHGTLPDGGFGTGGAAGAGSGGRGSGGVAGESSTGGVITVGAGGASTGGRGNGGTSTGGRALDAGSLPDASSGDLDAGPLRDAGQDAGARGCIPPCGPGSVCVREQVIGGAFIPPDAGRCPDPRVIVPESPNACSTPPSFTCEPVPGACTGAPDCSCAGSLCPAAHQCSDNVAGRIDCIERVP